MIHRSGSSARSRLPMSAATSRTRATTALSSVSGMVKNWGAWGSIAPPITVDLMINLPFRKNCTPDVPRNGDKYYGIVSPSPVNNGQLLPCLLGDDQQR